MAKKKPTSSAGAKSPRRSEKPAKTSVTSSPRKGTTAKTAPKPAPVAKPAPRSAAVAVKPAAPVKPVTNGKAHEPPAPPKIGKSPLSRKELSDFRKLLGAKRAELMGDMKSMSQEALRGDSANLSHMPLHMADVGSDNYEQELTLGIVENERELLTEIENALQRIEDGTYGVCIATGKPINKARLSVKPWAKYSVEAEREMERGGRRW